MNTHEYKWDVQTGSVVSIPPPPNPIHLLPWPTGMLLVKPFNQFLRSFVVLHQFPVCAYGVVISLFHSVT